MTQSLSLAAGVCIRIIVTLNLGINYLAFVYAPSFRLKGRNILSKLLLVMSQVPSVNLSN
jgi:hypothetical protein